MGNDALHCWADTALDKAAEQTREHQPELYSNDKKSRGRRGAISDLCELLQNQQFHHRQLMGWRENMPAHEQAAISHIQIKVDNGPDRSVVRIQFLKRLVDFVDHTCKIVQLLYYPYMDSSRFASIS